MYASSTVTGSCLCFLTVVDGRMDGRREYMCASSTVTGSCLSFLTVVDGRMERIHVCILYSNWFLSMFSHCC